jgi:ribosome-associated protein
MEKLQKLAQALVDKKGFNVIAIDVRGISTMTDYFLIVEGTVDRHVKALARAAVEAMGDEKPRVEGLDSPDWVVVDCWDVLVHIMTPELRQRYQIERIWENGEIVDLGIDFLEKENPVITEAG